MFDLVYDFKIDNKIKITKNMVYKIEGKTELKFDIFNADKSNKYKNKTVVLIHGSAPMEDIKDISIFQTWCKLFATKGFDSIVFNWRPDEDKDDVKILLEYIKNRNHELDINTSSIGVMAFSAGAEEGIEQVLKMDMTGIDDIIVYYGKLNEEIIDMSSTKKKINIFVVMGAKDDTFSTDCNDDFLAKVKNIGWNTTKVIHSDGEHGFDAFNRCSETDNIIERTLEFL